MYYAVLEWLRFTLYIQTVAPEWTFWWELTRSLGIPVTLLLLILVTGARGVWVYGPPIEKERERERAVCAERLAEKDEENKYLRLASQTDAETAKDSLQLLKEGKEIWARIEREMKRRGKGGEQ